MIQNEKRALMMERDGVGLELEACGNWKVGEDGDAAHLIHNGNNNDAVFLAILPS